LSTQNHIAIVGVAGRFPEATDVTSYFKNLVDGLECIKTFTDEELRRAGVPEPDLADPHYVRTGAVFPDMEGFDAGFFGFSPRDAAILDPQHRHFLEVSWEALEDAGYDPARFDGNVGVFGGSGHNAYMPYNLLSNPDLVASVGFFLLRHTGNDKDFLTTRVSYCFDLRGPSVAIQTACSTSLVAIHVACQSLLSGECDMALAGGVTIEMPHYRGYKYEEGEILSPDGHCRSFEERSQGTFFSSGVGVVVLKRLEDALAAGDTIRAVIVGSAINNDGANKVGYLAPSVDGQAAAVAEALALADVDARSISYVEAHGTGTPVGDPIEVAALTRAFRESTDDVGFCGLGSVKTNIGHTDNAAGVASLLKVVRALETGVIPRTLHFERPNPSLDLERSPFKIQATNGAWPRTPGSPRRAAVNSLGVGGTNAFVILEEAPAAPPPAPSRAVQLLVTSARSAAAADRAVARLGQHLGDHPDTVLADAAFTLQTGRRAFAHRRAVVASSAAEAAAASRDPARVIVGAGVEKAQKVVYLFPGGGAQYPGMGRGLYESEPVYRAELDRCLALLRPRVGDLKPVLFPTLRSDASSDEASERLERPSLSLPVLFATEYALAKLWTSWGVPPVAMVGHSMGEYTAACLAGVFSLEDALALVAIRGQLFEKVEPSGMLSVPLSAKELEPLLGPHLSIAAVNGSALTVASGPNDAISELARKLAAMEVEAQRVHIAIAAHSKMLEPILPEFGRFTKTIRFSEPKLPFASNVTGQLITAREATDPEYWVRHLRGTVRFLDGLDAVLADPNRALLEVGPGRALSTFGRARAQELGKPVACVSSLRHVKDESPDLEVFTAALGRLWVAGVDVDFTALHGEARRRRVPLPTYPFEHQRHWIEPGKALVAKSRPSLAKRPDIADWFYCSTFERRPLAPRTPGAAGDAPHTVVVLGGGAHGEALRAALRELGLDARDPGGLGRTLPSRREDLERDLHDVLSQLGGARSAGGEPSPTKNSGPATLVWLDPVLAGQDGASDGFAALLALGQSLGGLEGRALRLVVATKNAFEVGGESESHPEGAMLVAAARVLAREVAGLDVRAIDVDRAALERPLELARSLVDELAADPTDVVALRGKARFVRRFLPMPLADSSAPSRLREGGVYVITGGLGGIGLSLAEHLVARHAAKVVLVGRRALPADRRAWLVSHDPDDPTSVALRRIEELERGGGDVLAVSADVSTVEGWRAVLAASDGRFGVVHGVFHTAGVLDDGVVALETIEAARRVLAPKVQGAKALDVALADRPLDFVVYFSSISAITGLAGQFDYAAANAFLDAYAEARFHRTGQPTFSLGWNAWRDVGMAATLASSLGVADTEPLAPRGLPTTHPWLDRRVLDGPDHQAFDSIFSRDTHWVLGEHVLRGGDAVMPGTGYLELARAAFREIEGAGPVVLSDVTFVAPLSVERHRRARVRVSLERDERGWGFKIASGSGPELVEHCRGRVRRGPVGATRESAPPAIDGAERSSFPLDQEPHVEFGGRWANRVRGRFGDREAELTLQLPEAARGDLEALELHPALLDFATAGAQELIPGFDRAQFYVPLSYGTLMLHAPLEAEIRSVIRLREASAEGLATFGVRVFSAAGHLLVEVDDFTMRRVDGAKLDTSRAKRARKATANEILDRSLEAGIRTDEGMLAIERVLRGPAVPRILVSSQDLEALLASAEPTATDGGAVEAPSAAGHRVPRPALAAAFVAPKTALEQQIAKVFEELLGVEGVGVHDDFFELGGHSLLLTQLAARVRKQTKTEVGLRSLFEKRSVADLAAQIEAARAAGASSGPRLVRTTRRPDELVPAASAQERLWFLDQLEPGTAVYSIPQALRLRGPLDHERLRRAVQGVVDRHESLRTTFVAPEGIPLQRVHASLQVSLDVRTVEAPDDEQRLSEARRIIHEEAARPFDLAEGPLFRAGVVVLGPADHVLWIDVHHIVCDGFSLALFHHELSALYRGDVLPEVSVQYADFARWQSESLRGDALAKELAHWREALGSSIPTLELPTDRPRPATPTTRGAQLEFSLDRGLVDGVAALGRLAGASTFQTFLAAFQVLLHRLSGQTEVFVGSPVANRERPEIERAIGFYTNTVVFRGDLSGGPSFRALLERTREVVLSGLAHQDVPFDKLVEAVQANRNTSVHPLFQAMFALQQAPESALDLPGVRVELWSAHSRTSKFDVLCELQDTADGMQGFFEYNTDLFDAETAARFVRSFEVLLRAAVASPDTGIDELAVLDEASRRRQLEEWNATSADLPRTCVHELFRAQAARTPDAIAVELGDDLLRYADLDRRVNRLARALLDRGVTRGDRVGVFLERSLDMVATMLAVGRAGATYVPLDPAYPADRVAFMLGDSGARMVVSRSEEARALPASDASVLLLDAEARAIEACSDAPVDGASDPSLPAYVLYTSGSTGKPKGVVISQLALTNFIVSMQRTPGCSGSDRLLAVTTISFDISGLELYLPLTVGATVVLASRDLATSGDDLVATLAQRRISILQATPATFRVMLDAGWEQRHEGLKILCGGEAMPPELAERLLGRASEVWNMYGPTETTIWSTCKRITDAADITVGRPIANTTVYVLDAKLQPVVEGVAGDLYLGGAGVAEGYWGRDDLTRERFVPDPFRPGERVYKTGDRARLRHDGELVFLGRSDNQVKVRGFRIELGEIEAVLARHASVGECAVVVRDDGAGDKRIVAYCVYRHGEEPTASELRKFLRADLPEYMVPHLFVGLPALPLTDNRKVDRKALPDPFVSKVEARDELVEPRTPTEQRVAEVWRELLKSDRVGVHDNFFEIGGHSLLSMQVIVRLERRTGHRLGPRTLAFSTLEQIAAEIDAARPKRAPAAAIPPAPLPEPPNPHVPDEPPTSLSKKLFGALKSRFLR
jgi:amino acid adenylation domain-containing protein